MGSRSLISETSLVWVANYVYNSWSQSVFRVTHAVRAHPQRCPVFLEAPTFSEEAASSSLGQSPVPLQAETASEHEVLITSRLLQGTRAVIGARVIYSVCGWKK